LNEQLILKKFVCPRLKQSKHISLHISVIEDEFPVTDNNNAWPTGFLIVPFYGKLIPYQVYSSSTPVSGGKALPFASDTVNKCAKPKGDDGVSGSSSWCSK
jgi:hypothetical protein